MALQSSGAITLDQIHDEAGGTSGSTCTINDADIRGLIDADAGDNTSFDDWYGASAVNPRMLLAGGGDKAGNADSSNFIDKLETGSTGNTTDFGNLAVGVEDAGGGIASSIRGIFHGGGSANGKVNSIEYLTIATTGNGTDFGNLSAAKQRNAGCSSSTRGIVSGGITDSAFLNVIEYVTIANTGNVTDFGNLTATLAGQAGNVNSPTKGVFKSGAVNSSSTSDTIDSVTIASTGNAADFGDSTYVSQGSGGCSNATQGIFFGGSRTTARSSGGVNIIEKISIASAGNAADFGDLTSFPSNDPQYIATNMCGAGNATRGICASNTHGGADITFITFSSDGNSSDFGDYVNQRKETAGIAALSGAHGGL